MQKHVCTSTVTVTVINSKKICVFVLPRLYVVPFKNEETKTHRQPVRMRKKVPYFSTAFLCAVKCIANMCAFPLAVGCLCLCVCFFFLLVLAPSLLNFSAQFTHICIGQSPQDCSTMSRGDIEKYEPTEYCIFTRASQLKPAVKLIKRVEIMHRMCNVRHRRGRG